jgi:asparagine N-glycosylation enzyme membrane subunit Stt3
MKKALTILPELLLLGLSTYWFLENWFGNKYFNSFALVVMLVLIFQIFFQNRYIAFTLAALIAVFSIYMVFAVISEFHDFPSVTSEALQLLSVGLFFCFMLFSSSFFLVYKFLPRLF